ncbi:MAG: SDR family oxidoreductase [Burkholderiales bacterium]|nr:SDR family oxidoreductase [Burkholderiales bacterium]
MLLITGATGFVGGALLGRLRAEGRSYRTAGQTRLGTEASASGSFSADPGSQWTPLLSGCDAVVHLAARVHVMQELSALALDAFRAVNVQGTAMLARQAAQVGVRRFVFLSSVKVNGEGSVGHPYLERDLPCPRDAYGISKWEAEEVLREIARETGLEIVILRPPLVYGPGVKANFLRMMHWVQRGIPLPLGIVHNQRSIVYVGNLVDAIVRCIDHSAAAGETFLVNDGDPVSTPQLLREIGDALDRPARLFPFPPAVLKIGATLMGRGEDAARLLGDLVVDDSAIRTTLGWHPPFSRREGLAATAAWFRPGPR